jgi:hypothetical protein|tara:strand:+ start:1211 stop:1810 length:600 start_codon:yes stop_codon:yes gene_type:complete
MKYAIVNEGKVVGLPQVNQPFDCNGRRSARFLLNATEQECLDIGLYHLVEATPPDLRFYWEAQPEYTIDEGTKTVTQSYTLNPRIFNDREEVDQDNNPMWVKVLDNTDPENPQMVDSSKRLVTKGLKTIWTANFKKTVHDLLKPTDAKVMDETITEEETTYRTAVVAEGDRLDTAIAACTGLDGLINIVNSQNWPRVEI